MQTEKPSNTLGISAPQRRERERWREANELMEQTRKDGVFLAGKRTFMQGKHVLILVEGAFLRGERAFLTDKNDPLRQALVEVAAAVLSLSRSLVKPMVEQSCAKIAKRADTLDASTLREAVRDAVTKVLCRELGYGGRKAAARQCVERAIGQLERFWVQIDREAFAFAMPAEPVEGLRAWYA